MLGRAIRVAIVAAILILAPAAAMAYRAPGYTFTVTDPTPVVGVPFEVVLTGVVARERLTLTVTSNSASISSNAIEIAGTKSLTKTANANATATYRVTLSAAGSYTLVGTNAAGAVIARQQVVAAAAGAGGPLLGRTGFEVQPFLVGGGALVLAGAGAVLLGRRRHAGAVRA
ncbi:MAG TPA: peptidase [Dermatophilaceae bacterium]|nr:peptidase [Dermatophilaceae bacterium]